MSESPARRHRRVLAAALLAGGMLVAAACTPEEMAAYQNATGHAELPPGDVVPAVTEPAPVTTAAPATTAPAPPTTKAAPASTESEALRVLNVDRTNSGVAPLGLNAALAAKAQAWANHLASTGVLEHSQIDAGVDPGWWMLGENVGMGPTIGAIETAFMQSVWHRDNILNAQFNWAGTGIATATNGTLFVVQVFAQY